VDSEGPVSSCREGGSIYDSGSGSSIVGISRAESELSLKEIIECSITFFVKRNGAKIPSPVISHILSAAIRWFL